MTQTIEQLRTQLATAQEEIERLNGQISVYRLSFVELERQRDVEMTSATRWATGYHELRDQLATAQEEIQRMKRERLLTADAIESMHASHKDQLAKAEQRVAEACIALIEDRLGELDGQDSEWAAGQVGAIGEIADGGWRKFVKEV